MDLEAYALKATGTARILALGGSRIRLGEDASDNTTWIHVGYEGEWNGHQNGPFKLTADDFRACLTALSQRLTPPQVDYGHGSLFETDGLPKPKAGNVVGLSLGVLCDTAAQAKKLSADVYPMPKGGFLALVPPDSGAEDLWAKVEFNGHAAEMVRGKQYEFCSGVFVWGQPDRVTGEPVPCQLDSIGLTNRPFVDGQHSIALSAVIGGSVDFKKADIITKLDALVDGDTVNAEQLKALVAFLEDSNKKPEEPKAPEAPEADLAAKPEVAPMSAPVAAPAAAPLASPPEAPPAPVAPEMDVAGMVLTKLAELTGLANADLLASIEANADQIKAALLGGDGGALPYSALSTKAELQDATIAALSTELAGFRADKAKAADDALVAEVETLVLSGKAHPASREKWMSMARKSPTEFRALSSSLPVAFPLGKDAPPAAASGGGESLTSISAENIPETHPTYVALAAQLGDPKSPYAGMLPSEAGARKAAIDRAVRNHIRTSQPISG